MTTRFELHPRLKEDCIATCNPVIHVSKQLQAKVQLTQRNRNITDGFTRPVTGAILGKQFVVFCMNAYPNQKKSVLNRRGNCAVIGTDTGRPNFT
jgi:hypothetical protein